MSWASFKTTSQSILKSPMTFWIINKIIVAYIISTLTFLGILLFYKAARKRANIFLNKSNLIIIFVLLLNIIWVGEETIKCYISERKNTSMPPVDALPIYLENCVRIFIGTFFFAFLFHSLFFFNKHRTKISLTLISIILLTVIYNYERVIIFITSLYRDYLPSSWSTYYDTTDIVWTVVFSALYFALCWTNIKTFKNKNSVSQ